VWRKTLRPGKYNDSEDVGTDGDLELRVREAKMPELSIEVETPKTQSQKVLITQPQRNRVQRT
jgi:hypothetical protein